MGRLRFVAVDEDQLRDVLRDGNITANSTGRRRIDQVDVALDHFAEGLFRAVLHLSPQEFAGICHSRSLIIMPLRAEIEHGTDRLKLNNFHPMLHGFLSQRTLSLAPDFNEAL